MDLSYADMLIQEKRFSEAREYLSGLARKHPQHFDNIQTRIQKINKIDEAYNALFQQLLALYAKGEGEEALKLDVQRRMDELNPNPSEDQRRRLDELRSMSAFIEYNRRLRSIFTRARFAMDGGEYAKAARIYEEAFSLYRDEFVASAPGGPLVRDRAIAAVESLGTSIGEFEADAPSLAAIKANLAGAYAAPAPGALSALDAARPALDRLADQRARTASLGRGLRDQFFVFKQADPDLTDSSFLPFAYRAALGWTTEDSRPPNGILGAIDRQFEAVVGGALDAALGASDKALLSLEASYDAADWDAAAGASQDAAARAREAAELLSLRKRYYAKDGGLGTRDEDAAAIALDAARAQSLKHLEEVVALLARSASSRARLREADADAKPVLDEVAASGGAQAASRAAERILSFYRKADAERTAALGLAADVKRVRAKYESIDAKSKPPVPDWRARQERAEARAASDLAAAESSLAGLAHVAASIEYAAAAAAIQGQDARIQEGQALAKGVVSEDPELRDFLLRYPDRGMAVASSVESDARAANSRIKALIAKYRALPPFVLSSAPMQAWMAEASAGDKRTLEIIASAADLARTSRAQQQQADSARTEAELRVQEARAALRQANFKLADERIDRAQERYLDSLILQWDPALKARSEEIARALRAEIDDARQNRVVAEKRRLINQGKQYFYGGEFERAEDRFLQAQVLHRTVFDEDDPEAALWFRLSQTAVSIRSGRTIPETAPLYPEMSQLLSKARLLFEQGRDAIRRNRRTEGIARLNEAKALVEQVKVAFPRNQDAAVLGLQVEFLIDEGNAERLFRKYFDDAARKIDSPSQPTQYEGYNELLNLREIRPTWSGMSAAITRAQIRLGIIRPPADPAKIAEAKRLVALARPIVEKNNRPFFPVALENLNKAIALDPDNQEATALKDVIQRGLPQAGAQNNILSIPDLRRFKDAEALYAKGDQAASYAIVKQLWANAAYRNHRGLKSLYEKLAKAFGDL